jgi:CRP-like cAMP-binding protein
MNNAPTNLLLSLLPAEQRAMLMRLLEPVALPLRAVLFEPERAPYYVHFITSGLASIVTYMKEGEAAEVGLVGRDGLPEALHLLGPALIQTNCFMQIAGTGLRMRFKDFEQLFQRDEAVRRPVLRYVQFQNLVLSQIAACNRLHEVEERLARWLLMVSDRIGDSELRLTQEFLSQMLGARRSTVTLVAGTLQRGGLIEYSRGDVKILDRDKLESAACECYRITQDALKRLMQPTVVAL